MPETVVVPKASTKCSTPTITSARAERSHLACLRNAKRGEERDDTDRDIPEPRREGKDERQLAEEEQKHEDDAQHPKRLNYGNNRKVKVTHPGANRRKGPPRQKE